MARVGACRRRARDRRRRLRRRQRRRWDRGQHGRHREPLGDGDLGRRRAGLVPGRHRRLHREVPERDREVHVRRRQPRPAPLNRGQGREPAGPRRARPARPRPGLREAGSDPADRPAPRQDRRELRPGRGRRRHRGRKAVRADVQGRQQVDHLVQRLVLRRGRRRPAEDVGRPQAGRVDAEGRRDHAVLGGRRRRVAHHRPLRERLHPDRGARDVRQAREARDPVDRPVRQGRADE